MPEVLYDESPLFLKDDAHLGDIAISQFHGFNPCDVCGDDLSLYYRVEQEGRERVVRCCVVCVKVIVKRWSGK